MAGVPEQRGRKRDVRSAAARRSRKDDACRRPLRQGAVAASLRPKAVDVREMRRVRLCLGGSGRGAAIRPMPASEAGHCQAARTNVTRIPMRDVGRNAHRMNGGAGVLAGPPPAFEAGGFLLQVCTGLASLAVTARTPAPPPEMRTAPPRAQLQRREARGA